MTEPPASRTAGSQTLARGLTVLQAVAASHNGLAPTEVAEQVGIHRTVAYRLLNTLVQAGMVHRGTDGRYRGSSGLSSLAVASHQALLFAARPILRDAVAQLGSTVALIAREGQDAVALAVVTPETRGFHIAFTEGSRHPLDRGAAGIATLAAGPHHPEEAPAVTAARLRGHAMTYGEVEPGMYGLAVPLATRATGLEGCLNIITVREDQALDAVGPLSRAAERIASALTIQ